MSMRKWPLILACLLVASSPCPSLADMDAEIEHLLAYIDASGCTFVRNGKSHDSHDAGAHIRKKYAYIKKRIKTTEDFIRYAATKSSMSGSPYQVVCNGEATATADWLSRELVRFRDAVR